MYVNAQDSEGSPILLAGSVGPGAQMGCESSSQSSGVERADDEQQGNSTSEEYEMREAPLADNDMEEMSWDDRGPVSNTMDTLSPGKVDVEVGESLGFLGLV